MSRKLFKTILGIVVFGSLALSGVAKACPDMNNMTMAGMHVDENDHSCDMMASEQSDMSKTKYMTCCDFTALMPCEVSNLALISHQKSSVSDVEMLPAPVFVVHPKLFLKEKQLDPMFSRANIVNSQIIYQQTSRLRI